RTDGRDSLGRVPAVANLLTTTSLPSVANAGPRNLTPYPSIRQGNPGRKLGGFFATSGLVAERLHLEDHTVYLGDADFGSLADAGFSVSRCLPPGALDLDLAVRREVDQRHAGAPDQVLPPDGAGAEPGSGGRGHRHDVEQGHCHDDEQGDDRILLDLGGPVDEPEAADGDENRPERREGGYAPPLVRDGERHPAEGGQGESPPSDGKGGDAVRGQEERDGGDGRRHAGTDGVELERRHGEAGDEEQERRLGRDRQSQESGPVPRLVERDGDRGDDLFAF